MAGSLPRSYFPDADTFYLFTSLTAGSSHIITATSRLETILKANKIPFRAVDVATDEEARTMWRRRSKGKKLPVLVRDEMVVGDLKEIEEWNEYGELKEQLQIPQSKSGPIPSSATTTTTTNTTTSLTPEITTPSIAATAPLVPRESTPSRIQIQEPPSRESHTEDRITLALRKAGEEAASKAKENTKASLAAKSTPKQPEDTTPQPPSAALELESPKTAEPEPEAKPDSESLEAPKNAPERIKEIRESISTHRPSLSGVAAESTADLKVAGAEGMAMPVHHRGSVVSATSPGEQDQLAEELSTLQEGALLEDEGKPEKPNTVPATEHVEVKESVGGDGAELSTTSKDEGGAEKKVAEGGTTAETSKD
ncbi:hypothetical protein GX51_08081 [Blastomyces parvus]|uniref:Uncharacterized protein n=1 Tax=Blastomyces parvus TaxID=2060905 RepID=A0A2B7WH27_9EURO|nr:hypothetical protein GX51_08081 [Blastomyces parvus]